VSDVRAQVEVLVDGLVAVVVGAVADLRQRDALGGVHASAVGQATHLTITCVVVGDPQTESVDAADLRAGVRRDSAVSIDRALSRRTGLLASRHALRLTARAADAGDGRGRISAPGARHTAAGSRQDHEHPGVLSNFDPEHPRRHDRRFEEGAGSDDVFARFEIAELGHATPAGKVVLGTDHQLVDPAAGIRSDGGELGEELGAHAVELDPRHEIRLKLHEDAQGRITAREENARQRYE
jgi:hypothetical protein